MKNPDTVVKLYDAYSTFDQTPSMSPEDAFAFSPIRLGFIHEHDGKMLVHVADGDVSHTCRLWLGDDALGYSCTCPETSFCRHLAAVCAVYVADGGDAPLLIDRFLKEFGPEAVPAGYLEYGMDHYAAAVEDDELDDDEDEFDDDDGDDEDEDEEEWEDDEDDEADEDFEDEDADAEEDDEDLDDGDASSSEDSERQEAFDEVKQSREISKIFVQRTVEVLKRRLQSDGNPLSLRLLLAEAEQNAAFRDRLLFALAVNPGGVDAELLAAMFNDASRAPLSPADAEFGVIDALNLEADSYGYQQRAETMLKVFTELLWHGREAEALALLAQAAADSDNRALLEFIISDQPEDFRGKALRAIGE